MAWMSVTDTDGGEHVVNIDKVVRFASLGTGSIAELETGTVLYLTDSFESLTSVVLQADAKKAK